MMTNTQEEEYTLTHLAENLKDIAISDGYTEDFDSKIILLKDNNNLEEVT